MLRDYGEVFPDDLPMKLPPNRKLDDVHRIDLNSDRIIAKPPYRTGPAESDIIKNDIDKMLSSGIIRPSTS